MSVSDVTVDCQTYRSVMGLWPTGVSVVTGRNAEGEDFGLVIGSFASVSMEPPLVSFCPQKTSASWLEMRKTKSLCINFLSEFQNALCWKFATGDIRGRFADVACTRSNDGVAWLPECTAWVDVDVEREIEAGDHWIVLCRVKAMRKGDSELPMSFVKGKLCKSQPIFQPADDRLGEWEASINSMFYPF